MRAAVCREFGAPLAIEPIELAPPGPGEVRVKIQACAICHSDIHFMDGAWGGPLPAVFGHEAAGVVADIGPGVRSVSPGQTVVVTLIRSCGNCVSCQHGHEVSCEATGGLGPASPIASTDGEALVQGMATGAFADEVVVHESQLVGVTGAMDSAAVSLLACGVITGYGAVVNTARVEPGATVAVIGAGGVGVNAIQGAKAAGAAEILALDINDAKLETALRFGATQGVDCRDPGQAVEAVRAATGGRGADYVFVTVGLGAAVSQAFELCAPSGAIVLVGMPPSGVTVGLDPGELAGNNQRILGSKMGGSAIRSFIPALIEAYRAGDLKLDELVSGRYPLEGINEAVASARGGAVLRNVILF